MARCCKVPSYRRHVTGQAVVRLNGHDYYLGKHGTEASKKEYDRLIADWLRDRGQPPALPPASGDVTVKQVLAAFLIFAQREYVKCGRPVDGQLAVIRSAFRPLVRRYGSLPVAQFGKRELKQVRTDMIEAPCAGCAGTGKRKESICGRCGGTGHRPWTRGYINKCIAVIRHAWRWASEEELIQDHLWHSLAVVRHLKRGRQGVRPDPEPVGPVPDDTVKKTLEHAPPVVADLLRVQRLALMRPCEARGMRTEDIDRSGRLPDGTVLAGLWVYIVADEFNKLAHLGIRRVVLLGPKAQAVLAPYLARRPAGFLFSPAESARRWLEDRGRAQAAGHKRPPGEHYTKRSLNHAVDRACRRAGVPHWSPGQLRHSGATEVRELEDLQTAGDLMGHSSLETSKRYAAMKLQRAAEVARRIG